jgi:hypothetical protein
MSVMRTMPMLPAMVPAINPTFSCCCCCCPVEPFADASVGVARLVTVSAPEGMTVTVYMVAEDRAAAALMEVSPSALVGLGMAVLVAGVAFG